MKRNVYWLLVICLLTYSLCIPAFATQPCLPSQCAGTSGEIDSRKCAQLSAWIATGVVSSVVHHEIGDPLFKDFAEFTFTVQVSEKGAIRVGRQLRFKVGWCENWQVLPNDISGTFRFYGLPLPTDATLPNQYLYFERVPGDH